MSQQVQPPTVPAPTGHAAPPARGTNTMAVLALVFAFVFSPLGIVFGVLGRRQIKHTAEGGRGLATAGLVLGIVFTALGLLVAVLTLAGLILLPKTLDSAQVQTEIVRVTQSSIGVAPTTVQCPSGIPVKAGTTSSCTAQLDGQPVKFTITQQDDNGNLQINGDGFLFVPAMVTTLQQQVEAQVGVPVTATCDTGGQQVVIQAAPGDVIACTVAATDDPTATLEFAVTVTDTSGNVEYEQVG
jgi:hypothetical protein